MNKDQMLLFAGPARARRNDPETSHQAAASVAVSALHTAILRVLEEGPAPDFEIRARVERHIGHSVGESSVRSRRAELVRLGRVCFTGSWTLTPTGRKCRIWRLGEKSPNRVSGQMEGLRQ